MNATSGLTLMITATWVLLLAETFVFFEVIRPLAPNIHESMSSSVLKVGAIVGLLVVWGVAMFFMQAAYVRRARRPSTARSEAEAQLTP